MLFLSGCSGKTPENIGLKDGMLTPCPEKDNCVSSQSLNEKFKVDPIPATGDIGVVMGRLSHAIESMFGSKIVTVEGHYLRAEFTSRFWRFVDDLECYYDEKNGLIHVRSASRVGQSDFNANRKRVEELRKLMLSQ